MDEFAIFFIITLGLITLANYIKKNKNIEYVVSTYDNTKYLVRKLPDSLQAANKLAELNSHILKIIDACQKSDRENVELLKENYNTDTLSETVPGSKYTSYSVNKGEKISICIRNTDNSFMDMNTILFVTIHELAHVMTISTGHTEEFWSNMKFILEVAESIGLYKPIDYKSKPETYCGMVINSTPYDFNKEK